MPAAPADNRVAVGVARLGHPAGATQVREPFKRHRLFFFQAEDGIRDIGVTGVQTCALPISIGSWGDPHTIVFAHQGYMKPADLDAAIRKAIQQYAAKTYPRRLAWSTAPSAPTEIGRASCRERV